MDWRSEAEEQDKPQASRKREQASVRLAIFSNAAQDPVTLLPLLAALLALVYLLVLEPIFGGRLVTTILLVLSLGSAGVSFVLRFGGRYHEEHAKQTRLLTLRQVRADEQAQEAAVRSLKQRLDVGFGDVGSNEGAATLHALNAEWGQLEPVLLDRKATDPLSLGEALNVSRETYERGLSALRDALALLSSAGLAERKRLEWEIAQLTGEINADAEGGYRQQIKQDTLSLHEQRLRLLEQLEMGAAHLIFQARRCEVALQRTRVEIAAMRYGGAGEGIDAVVQALSTTMEQVKEVQEELKRYGY